jgi:hypothetical protein
MNTKYWLIDNFLTDEELTEALQMSSEVKYFPPGLNYFKGMRSIVLSALNPTFDKRIVKKVYGLPISRNTVHLRIDTSFHKLTVDHIENYSLEESAWHTDPASYAGVVYLNKNPIAGTGTLLKIDSKILEIENKFNRAIFYKADVLHRVAGVKSTNEDARLTLVIFIDSITLSSKK